jgi:hypothetical protein
VADATDYQWTVPAGATILSGQGTSEITVNWGGLSSAGNVSLKLIRPCNTYNFVLPVRLLDDNSCILILDDMDGNTNVTYESWTSTGFAASHNNPYAVGNTSAMCGLLVKTNLVGTNQFILGNVPIQDYSSYESGQRILYMDLLSFAPPNTTVEIRFINSVKAQGAYPAGVRTILRAKTSVQYLWETLVFKFDHLEDPSALITEIDQMAVVFNPEQTVSGKSFYFDNIKRGILPYDSIAGNSIPTSCDLSNELYSATNNGAAAYQWTAPSGTTINAGQGTHAIGINWSSVRTGRIYLSETISGCTAYTGTLDVTSSCPTAIVEGSSSSQNLKMYPNPTKDRITVSCELSNPTDVKLMITSSLGEVLLQETYSSQMGSFSNEISTQSLMPGTYIVQLVTDQTIRSAKLIKY